MDRKQSFAGSWCTFSWAVLEKEKIKTLAVLLPVTQPVVVVTCRLERTARLGCQGEPAGSAACESCSGAEEGRAGSAGVRAKSGTSRRAVPRCRSEAGAQLSPRRGGPLQLSSPRGSAPRSLCCLWSGSPVSLVSAEGTLFLTMEEAPPVRVRNLNRLEKFPAQHIWTNSSSVMFSSLERIFNFSGRANSPFSTCCS